MGAVHSKVWIALAILVASCPAMGQVVPVQSGRALDASYQIGSGGYNNSVNTGTGVINGQLYVNGQVTGLAGFHGHVPYSATNQLTTNVPSADFSTFQAQSVGVQDVLNGATYRTSAYIDAARFTPSAGATTPTFAVKTMDIGYRGAGGIDTSVSYASKLYMDAISSYAPIMTSEYGQSLSTARPMVVPVGGEGAGTTLDNLPSRSAQPTFSRPGAAALFGLTSSRDRIELANELYDMQLNDERVFVRQNSSIQANMPSERPSDISVRPGAPRPDEFTAGGAHKPKVDVPGPEVGNIPSVRANQDIYLDMLLRLHEQRAGEEALVRQVPGTPRPTSRPAGDETTTVTTPRPRPGLATTRPMNILGQEMPTEIKIVEVTKDKNIVLHGLAGVSPDEFNVHMGRAEKKLKAGRYYDAAGDYEIAITLNPTNPLPQVGLCLSLLGAGEPLSAGFYLRRAMEMFPPMMETRVDLLSLLDKDVLNHRLAAIRRRLEDRNEKPDPVLVFLAAYMSRNSGEVEATRQYAEQLKSLAGGDKLLTAYADYVLTGKKPQARSATAPARASRTGAASAPASPGKSR